MMLLRERAGYRGGLTIESGGARGRQAAPPSPPLYGRPHFRSLPGQTERCHWLSVRGRGQAAAGGGVMLSKAWSCLAIGLRGGGAGPGR